MKISALKKVLRTYGASAFADEVWEHASLREKYVSLRLIQLSEDKLSVEYSGFGAGVSGRIKDERTEEEMAKAPFDLTVKRNNVKIAELEVAADRKYTWDRSHIIPTRADKVERAKGKSLPCFMVFVLTLEDPPKVLWLPLETIAEKGEKRTQLVYDRHGAPTKPETNYFVSKKEWNIGLESLVHTLQTLSDEI